MKIGFIRTSSIGDVVLATACLDYLRQVVPDAQVIWVGRNPSLKLIQDSWTSLMAIEWGPKKNSSQKSHLLDVLSTCDAVIDLQTSFRTRMLGRLLKRRGVKVFAAEKFQLYRMRLIIAGFVRGRWAPLSVSGLRGNKFQYQMMLDALHDALMMLNKSNSEALSRSVPLLFAHSTLDEDSAFIRELAIGQWIAVCPGASHPTKRAPTEIFAEILQNIGQHCVVEKPVPGIVFVGGPEDRSASVELSDQINWEGPVLNLAGKLSLDQTLRVLGRATVLLSNDSGLAHIAEAIGRPVSVLFGPTTEAFGFAPRRVDSRAFSSRLGCRPCSKHGKKSCRYEDQLCFRAIDTRAVASHLIDYLTRADLK